MTASKPAELAPLLRHPTRLQILAFLSACKEAEFGAVRDHCRVSDATLSKAVALLEDQRYVKVRKGYLGKYPRTWLAATSAGRRALDAYLEALETIVTSARQAGATSSEPLPTLVGRMSRPLGRAEI